MAYHHPTEDMLFDYATGALGEGLSLVIATHLTYCPACRSALRLCEAVGGTLLATQPAEDVAPAVPERLDVGPATASRRGASPEYPAPLAAYTRSGIFWRTTFPGLQEATLAVLEPGVSAKLMRIAARRAMPRHTHRGMEATLVLQGGFSDQFLHYGRGDVALADDSVDHRPRADAGAPCVCLAVTAAPLQLTGPVGRLFDYLIKR